MSNRSFTYNIDHATREIVMSKAFADNASKLGTKEYRVLIKLRKDLPNYAVIRRTAKKSANQHRYVGLTFDKMEEYIKAFDSNAKAEYEQVRIAAAFSGSPYAFVKKWFLIKYKDEYANSDFARTLEEVRRASSESGKDAA